ncbi:MAG: NADH-quinone oxidoreductase subunit L, partial [Clostridiales bacterium]
MDYFWLIPLPILATLIITLIFGNRLGLKSAFLGILGTGSSFVMSLMVLPAVIAGERCSLVFPWIPGVNLGFMLDPLTLIMLLLVSFLSTLIILYAYGYMRGEDGLMRFFAEVQLFAFSMLSIVIA